MGDAGSSDGDSGLVHPYRFLGRSKKVPRSQGGLAVRGGGV